MKTRILPAAVVFVASLLTVSPASAQGGSVAGFGGFTLSNSQSPSLFGGSIAVDLTPHIQAIGEAGRISDVLPSTVASLIAFTPIDLRVSAFYGEGGVRFVSAPASRVTPYVEATAGVARLRTGFSGASSTIDPFARAALRFFDTTEPLAGVGGGVMFRAGPVVVDAGYRYKKFFTTGALQDFLSAGDGFTSQQARIGVGVRF
jgi:hypothetical protein